MIGKALLVARCVHDTMVPLVGGFKHMLLVIEVQKIYGKSVYLKNPELKRADSQFDLNDKITRSDFYALLQSKLREWHADNPMDLDEFRILLVGLKEYMEN